MTDEHFLRRAIALAFQARENGCDPFGAVLVKDGVILYEGYDHCVDMSDPTYHAELSVVSNYCRSEKLFSLHGCTLYCSAEPCPMCIGAIHWSPHLARGFQHFPTDVTGMERRYTQTQSHPDRGIWISAGGVCGSAAPRRRAKSVRWASGSLQG